MAAPYGGALGRSRVEQWAWMIDVTVNLTTRNFVIIDEF